MAKKLYPATIEITNCRDCPHKIETNHYSTDGFDRMVDWECSLIELGEGNCKKIQGAVEWHEEKRIKVPKWCPLRVKRKKQ